MSMSRVATALATAVVAVLAVSGCSQIINAVQGKNSAFDLRPGDCFVLADYTEELVDTVKIVDCGEAHTAEVVSSHQLPGDSYPGEESIFSDIESICGPSASDYTGMTLSYDSDITYDAFFPTSESWSGGDRELLCLIFAYDGRDLTESYKK